MIQDFNFSVLRIKGPPLLMDHTQLFRLDYAPGLIKSFFFVVGSNSKTRQQYYSKTALTNQLKTASISPDK